MKKYKNTQPIIVNEFFAQATFDYHNLGILNSYEIQKHFEDFLLDCEFLGYKKVLIITGKGQVVRPAVAKLLRESKKVESFKTAGYFNGQDGAFEITLK